MKKFYSSFLCLLLLGFSSAKAQTAWEGIGTNTSTNTYTVNALGSRLVALGMSLNTYLYTYLQNGETYNIISNLSSNSSFKFYKPDGTSITIPNANNNIRTFTASTAGIYVMEIPGQNSNSSPASYGIRVLNGSTLKTGRTFTLVLPLSQNQTTSTPVDFSLYYMNASGIQYQTTFKQFDGMGYSYLCADPYGIVTKASTLTSALVSYYKSGPDPNNDGFSSFSGIAAGIPYGGGSSSTYIAYNYVTYKSNYFKQFFASPSSDLPATASVANAQTFNTTSGSNPVGSLSFSGTTTTWLNPALTSPTVSNITLNSKGSSFISTFNVANYTGSLAKITFAVYNASGTLTGSYTNSNVTVVNNSSNAYTWDGTDGAGNNLVSSTSKITTTVTLTHNGEIHFVMDDVEGLGGIIIKRLTDNTDNIYWDDNIINTNYSNSQYRTSPITGSNVSSTNGGSGVHGWQFNSSSWGNNNYIDNWAYETNTYGSTLSGIAAAITGKVGIDGNGTKDNLVTIGNPIASNMYVLLVDGTNKVVASAQVKSDGSYSIINNNQTGSFTAILSNTDVAIGTSVTSASLPTSTLPWTFASEGIGTTPDNTTADGKVAVTLSGTTLSVNFGINQTPSATGNSYSLMYQPQVGAVYSMTASASTGSSNVLGQLQGSDYEDGTYNGNGTTLPTVEIVSLPTNGATLLYQGNAVTTGQTITNYTAADLQFKFTGSGYKSSSFTYAFIDKAGVTSSAASYAISIPYALPITLTSFSGASQNNTVLLQWQTSSEINSKEFDIQRSTDGGTTFVTIGAVAAAGNSNVALDYSYTDLYPSKEDSYRLNIIDIDGSQKYSKTITINPTNNNYSNIKIAPNPVSDLLHIYNSPIGSTLRIINISGQIMQSSVVTSNITNLPVSSLPSGIYIVEIQGKDGTHTSVKFVKK